ncbi:DNA replication protein DnaC [Clostridium sp. chh4-2]|uniref:ATP-binding protein n=1 Tax=Clostridium sp. chh4-2 TaxID=2067550 RepID=UPI000CCE736F|nr:ATP-binding protein [Clostridium sp. chh4-2]PNV60870.1 DNA replication protein DnaC [Clostridium sp. chh4-2]
MGLSNSQYNAIMRIYNQKQFQNKHEQDKRIEEVHTKYPVIQELESVITGKAVERAKRLLDGDDEAGRRLKGELEDLREQKRVLLKSFGYPENYMEMQYSCKDCEDTGYHDGKKCHCFRKEEIKLLYAQSNLEEVMKKENFGTFSDQYFDKSRIVPGLGISVYDYMMQVKQICHNYVDQFGVKKGNILFQGDTGVGKTFLTNCIAKDLIDHYYSVIYLSSTDLFHIFAQNTFERTTEEEMKDMYQHILDCDLLIIDDLGTELNNSFVSSQFFYCINERLMRKNGTIISTNLDMEGIRDRYTERVSSRIISEYMITPLYGSDIRTKKY